MPVEVTNELSPEMQAVADCREHVKKMEAGVEHAKSELKTAKTLLEDAQSELNRCIDELIDNERQPTLFDRLGDDLKDEPEPARTVVSEPEPAVGEEDVTPLGSLVFLPGIGAATNDDEPGPLALPPGASQPTAGGVPTRDQFPPDRTGRWEFIAAAFFFSHEGEDRTGKSDISAQDTEYRRLKDQIADYRGTLDFVGRVETAWGQWCEFSIGVQNAAGVSVTVEVLYKPGWGGKTGKDHLDFYAPVLGTSGYWSCEEQHPVKDGEAQYPAAYTLEERAAKLAQEAADRFIKEQKKAARKSAGKAKKGA